MLQGKFLHFRGLYLCLMTTYSLIGLRNNGYNVVVILYQSLQSLNSKLWCSHKHDT